VADVIIVQGCEDHGAELSLVYALMEKVVASLLAWKLVNFFFLN
jgi:hypothetical protein